MTATATTSTTEPRTKPTPLRWISAAEAIVALGVVAWVCATEWGGVAHAHPAYPVMLGLTIVGATAGLLRAAQARQRGGAWRTVVRIAVVVIAAGWIALTAWLRPHTAEEPALTAMQSTADVTVTETPTRIVLAPTGTTDGTGVFFQPGALVDARAYAAVLRPQAQDGHVVVIAKQPLDIAFLALGAFDDARHAFPHVHRWAVGGHSLGGTVAAMQADAGQHEASAPAAALFFYASYPASDVSASLRIPVASISGTRDGLSTPAKIAASRSNLPSGTGYTAIVGANHGQFGAYGPQPGDRTATISDAQARREIGAATTRFLASLPG